MLLKLAIYVPLWASCLLICLGLTLMLVVQFSELLTDHLRIVLLRVCCYAELLFLLCTWQWVYALVLAGFMFDKHDNAFRRWLDDATGKSLRFACGFLILSGCLGVFDALDWFPVILRPLVRGLRHPAISVGILLAALATVCWNILTNKRGQSVSGDNSQR